MVIIDGGGGAENKKLAVFKGFGKQQTFLALRRKTMKRHTFVALSVVVLFILFAGSAIAVDKYEARKVTVAPKIDGNLSDWAGVGGIFLTGSLTQTGTLDDKPLYGDWEPLGETWDNDKDMSATWYATWDDGHLYFACLVKDEFHGNTRSGDGIWNGDCLQFTIDPTGEKKVTGGNIYEYGYALTDGGPAVWRWYVNPASKGETSDFAIVRSDSAGTTTYEVAIPEDNIAPADLSAGKKLGFSVVVNDNDVTGGQGGWVGWFPHAIVFFKAAEKTGDLILSGELVTAVSSMGKISTTWGSIKH